MGLLKKDDYYIILSELNPKNRAVVTAKELGETLSKLYFLSWGKELDLKEVEEKVKEDEELPPEQPRGKTPTSESYGYYSYITKKGYSSLEELKEEEFNYLKEIEEKVKEEKELLRLVNKYNKIKKELREALEAFGYIKKCVIKENYFGFETKYQLVRSRIPKFEDSNLIIELFKNISNFGGL